MTYATISVIFICIAIVAMCAASVSAVWRHLSGLDDGDTMMSLTIAAIAVSIAFVAATR